MRAARTRIARRQHDIPRQLALNVEIELLHHPLLEIAVHGLNGSSVNVAGLRAATVNRLHIGLEASQLEPEVLARE